METSSCTVRGGLRPRLVSIDRAAAIDYILFIPGRAANGRDFDSDCLRYARIAGSAKRVDGWHRRSRLRER
jgi:hypothetical protein